MIRSANYALGIAVNRVAVLAECAAAGSAIRGGSLASRTWMSRQVALLRFHSRVQALLMVDWLMRAWSITVSRAQELRRHFALTC